MDIKILVATHKKYDMPSEDIYLPIHVGREGKEDLGYQGDNQGENISLKNSNYKKISAKKKKFNKKNIQRNNQYNDNSYALY